MGAMFQTVRIAGAIAILGLLAACADGAADGQAATGTGDTRQAQYATYSDQFAELQTTGLRGDYPGFARALKVDDPASVVAQLNRSFRGQPFDVFTRDATSAPSSHKRAVELRSRTGRMYLFVEMEKVPGGWVVSGHDLSRQSEPILARL